MSENERNPLGGGAELIVEAYRAKILYALAVIATVVLLPFSIGNFVKGYTLIGAASMAVVLIFVADAAAIYLRRRLPVPIPVAFVVIMIALVIAIWGRGLLGMDGGDFSAALLANPQTHGIPLVFLTALVSPADLRAKGNQLAGRAAISKQSPIEEIAARIRAALQ